MRPAQLVLPLLPLLLSTSGCRGRGAIDSLVGTWTGELDCSDEIDNDVVNFTTSVILDLQEQDKMTYTGTLDAVSIYTWRDQEVVQEATYDTEVQQSRAQGDQPVKIEKATCTDLLVTVDDTVEADSCDHTSLTPPTGDMRWDGADTFRIRRIAGDEEQNCTGTLQR